MGTNTRGCRQHSFISLISKTIYTLLSYINVKLSMKLLWGGVGEIDSNLVRNILNVLFSILTLEISVLVYPGKLQANVFFTLKL